VTDLRTADYCASKAALLGLHDALRAELRALPDIRLTLVCPGHMPTPLFADARIPSRLARFAFPTVGPHTVTKQIVAALDAHESRDVYVPWMTRFAWLDRGAPRWLNDFVHWVRSFPQRLEYVDGTVTERTVGGR
jgi:short-subunit dehydrogenase